MVDDCSLKIARHSLSGYVASVLSDSPASRFVRLSVYPFVSPSFLIRLSVDLKPYTRHVPTHAHTRAHIWPGGSRVILVVVIVIASFPVSMDSFAPIRHGVALLGSRSSLVFFSSFASRWLPKFLRSGLQINFPCYLLLWHII